MTWKVGTDVAPTSLDEGRGEAVPVFVVVFHPSLKCRLVNGWGGGGGTSKGQASSPNLEMYKCGKTGKRGKGREISRRVQQCRKP